MTKKELIKELVKSRISEARLKKIRNERTWYRQANYNLRQLEHEITLKLSGEFSVGVLCKPMGIQRSSFYYWKKRLSNPVPKIKALTDNVILFREYHLKYPSHGYRWLSAKIRLDTGLKVSDTYAHKCCKIAGIKSGTKHYRYKKSGEPRKVYPNLVLAGLKID